MLERQKESKARNRFPGENLSNESLKSHQEKHTVKDSLEPLGDEVILQHILNSTHLSIESAGKLLGLVRWSLFQEVTWKETAIETHWIPSEFLWMQNEDGNKAAERFWHNTLVRSDLEGMKTACVESYSNNIYQKERPHRGSCQGWIRMWQHATASDLHQI